MSFAFFFDATDPSIENIGEYTLVPEGQYVATIASAQVKEGAQNVNQKALELKWKIISNFTDGSTTHANKTFFTSYWFSHENHETQKIAQKFIKNICLAVNVLQVENTQQFVGKTCGIVVGIQKSTDPKYRDKNRILRAFPLDANSATGGTSNPADVWD